MHGVGGETLNFGFYHEQVKRKKYRLKKERHHSTCLHHQFFLFPPFLLLLPRNTIVPGAHRVKTS